MEIGACLIKLELTATDPSALAAFYARTYGLQGERQGDVYHCRAPGRELAFGPGAGGQLQRVTLQFANAALFAAHRDRLVSRDAALLEDEDAAYAVRDPEGRVVRFVAPGQSADSRAADCDLPAARLQHFAVRSPEPAGLLAFYTDVLGFVISDLVLDAAGELTAAFLRTDAEHHTMAIFRAAEPRFDHFSCEVDDWGALRDWADHMASVGIALAWGVGRHGPGNDTFFMIKDMDGNMAEISAELEVCAPDRPAGQWPHQPSTLNQWGVAIMRS